MVGKPLERLVAALAGLVALTKPGDWLLFGAGLAVVAALAPDLWQRGFGERAEIRQDGQTVLTVSLAEARRLTLTSELGVTTIVVSPPRIRVESDPGRHQYCVRQGWLSRPGDIAICAPTRISVHVTGRLKRYDSLSY